MTDAFEGSIIGINHILKIGKKNGNKYSIGGVIMSIKRFVVSYVLRVCDMPVAPFEPLDNTRKQQVRNILTAAGIFQTV